MKIVACIAMLFASVANGAHHTELMDVRARAAVDMSTIRSCQSAIRSNKTFSANGGCEWILERGKCTTSGMYWFSHVHRNVYAKCHWDNGCVATQNACFIEYWENGKNDVGVHTPHGIRTPHHAGAGNKLTKLGKRVINDGSALVDTGAKVVKKTLNKVTKHQAKQEAAERREKKERKAERLAKKADKEVDTDSLIQGESKAAQKAELVKKQLLEKEVIASVEGHPIVGKERLANVRAAETAKETSLLAAATYASAPAPAPGGSDEGVTNAITEEEYFLALRTQLADMNAHHDMHNEDDNYKNLKIQGNMIDHQQNNVENGMKNAISLQTQADEKLASFIDDQISTAVKAWE